MTLIVYVCEADPSADVTVMVTVFPPPPAPTAPHPDPPAPAAPFPVPPANRLGALGRSCVSPLHDCRVRCSAAFVGAVMGVRSERGRGAREHEDHPSHKNARLDCYSLP